MQQFQINPIVQCFSSHTEFTRQVAYTNTDCILTVRHLNETWVKPLNLASTVLLYEDYGEGEPTDEMIDRLLADFRKINCTRVIGLGGGSVLDTAKLLALCPTGEPIAHLFEGKTSPIKDKELILVPTTCGTGSEITCISIAGIPSKNTKKGLAHPALFADTAALIPELLYGLPRHVLITSSLDAMTHAMEAFVSPKAHPHSELFSIEAIRLILQSYQTLLSRKGEGVVQEIAADLLRASNYAGIAFGNAGVGAVHALAYPLGQKCHVSHGEACARFLGTVFQVYRDLKPEAKMKRLELALAAALGCTDGQNPWKAMEVLMNRLLPSKPLRAYGMNEADIDIFADSVILEQQRLLANNYVELTRDEIRKAYRQLW